MVSSDESVQLKPLLTPAEQIEHDWAELSQIGDQLNDAITDEQFEAIADREMFLKTRIDELTARGFRPAQTIVKNEISIYDDESTAEFGSEITKIPGVESVKFVSKNDNHASKIKDKDMVSVTAFTEKHQDKDGGVPIDSFEVVTRDGISFRLIDVSEHLSANAREPFAKGNLREFKQRALSDLVNELVLFSASNFSSSGKIRTVTQRKDLRYLQVGNKRVYFKPISIEQSENTDGVESVRAFVYIGSCQKNMESNLYMTLLGINMHI